MSTADVTYRRITRERVAAALEQTGATLKQGRFWNRESAECCAIGACVLTDWPALPEEHPNLSRISDALSSPYDYLCGVVDGFEGHASLTELILGDDYSLGYADGIACRALLPEGGGA